MSSKNEEYVLAIPRPAIEAMGINAVGITEFDRNELLQFNDSAFAVLPRSIASNKSESSLTFGYELPQIVTYNIVQRDGLVLLYRRKSKDAGIGGKWSIGVGGHISHDELFECDGRTVNLATAINNSTVREFKEEIGVDIVYNVVGAQFALSTTVDPTSRVHVGFVSTINLGAEVEITPDPEEFFEVSWHTLDEIKAMHFSGEKTFETWSKLILEYV